MLERHLVQEKGAKNGLLLAPTSGGKTLVAIVLLLHTMLVEKKDGLLALPFIALVSEKVRELKVLSTKLGLFSIAEYAGCRGHFPPRRAKRNLRTLYVATTEKAMILWKSLCRDGDRRAEIGLTVFDELHMLGEGVRGAVLEELIVSMLHLAGNTNRLFALSATVGNPEEIQAFLGGGCRDRCSTYYVTKRPKRIAEFMVVSGSAISIERGEDGRGHIDFASGRKLVLLEDGALLADSELDMFTNLEDRMTAKLVFEAMMKEASVLIFCSTRSMCPQLCNTLTKACEAILTG